MRHWFVKMRLLRIQRDNVEKFWVLVLDFYEVVERESTILHEIQVVHGPDSLAEVGVHLKQLFHQMMGANDLVISVPRNFAITSRVFAQIKEFHNSLEIV